MMRYNVIGRIVNECSRIESYSVGGQVLISGESLEQIACPVEIHNRMEITAKGIQKPVTVKEVIGIGGEYQLMIANVDFDVLSPITEWIIFNLYAIPARLVQFSYKRAVVELEDFQAELKTYSDVEIFAAGKEGRAIFTGVYAKVVKRQFDRVVLHFTHVSRSFQNFSEQFVTEGTGKNNL